MAPMMKSIAYDKYHGRRDICILVESMTNHIFPVPTSVASSSKSPAPPKMSGWLAYIFYRTALPNQTIFHAIHLLRRIAATLDFDPSISRSPLVQHRLVFTALVLATKYWMDDSYSNKSFSVASRGLFTLKEVNEMEFELLEGLNWKIGEEGLVEILEGYEIEFSRWSQKLNEQEEQLKEIKKEIVVKKALTDSAYLSSLANGVPSDLGMSTNNSIVYVPSNSTSQMVAY